MAYGKKFVPVVDEDGSNEVEDLWDVTFYLDRDLCFTFGYFTDELSARTFSSKILMGDLGSIQDQFVGNLVELGEDAKVLIRPNSVCAVEIGHPFEWEVRRSWWERGDDNAVG